MIPEFLSPSDIDADERDPKKVRRSKDGRPYVKQGCPNQGEHTAVDELSGHGPGRVLGKRPGTTKQCPDCKGKGYVEKLYTRCTTFVSALEPRNNLELWKLRTAMLGLAVDAWLYSRLMAADPDDRDELDAIADRAFDIGDGRLKARKGTDLHKLAEYVDSAEPLPKVLIDPDTGQERPVTIQDRADMAAWHRLASEIFLRIEGTEVFVVNDEYRIGGTYDRQAVLKDPICPELGCSVGMPTVVDLKTGRVDYGAGKMAQQLAVYANSKNYDPETGARSEQSVCLHYGLVIHLRQGTGEAEPIVVDLIKGWEDVALSDRVREHRRVERERMWPLAEHQERMSRI